ncbi:MAG: outer membrane beta-barrel protein [Gammaproteobacteria bacterium]
MRKGLVFASIAAMGMFGSALADSSFEYSFVELGYVNTELDDSNIDGDGFQLRGSLEVTGNLHVFTQYSHVDMDANIDVNDFEVGAGYAWPVSPNLDVVGTLSYLKTEIDVPRGRDIDDDGFGLGIGLRGRVHPQIELTAGLKHVDYDDSGDNTFFNVGGRYFFTKAFAAGIDVTFDDDATTWYVGGRWSFGK